MVSHREGNQIQVCKHGLLELVPGGVHFPGLEQSQGPAQVIGRLRAVVSECLFVPVEMPEGAFDIAKQKVHGPEQETFAEAVILVTGEGAFVGADTSFELFWVVRKK